VAPPHPHASDGRPGQQHVHALLATGCRRTPCERAWEQVTQQRGGAGLDAVTSAPCEAHQEDSRDRLHGQRREGTSPPTPMQRVEIPTAAGGVRTLGRPRVWERVCQPALVQRRAPRLAPTCRARSGGSRTGRAPPEARRQVWRELTAGQVGRVEAARRQCVDTMAPDTRSDRCAAARSAGRVLPRVRDRRRAGVLADGRWRPTRPGGPQGGVASPRWSHVVLPPCERRRAAAGCRLTRGAEACVGRGQTRAEAPRAWALAARCRREALGGERPAQQPRMVPGSPGFECLGDTVQQGPGPRLAASTRRGRSHPQHLEAIPRETSGPRFQEQLRRLTRRQAPLQRRAGIARITPVRRGGGHFDRQAAVKRLVPRLDRWIAPRLAAFLAKRWRQPRWRQ
jgi:RNA-directed DNA polymerase